MTETYILLCDRCVERLDAGRHPENRYFLTELTGSRRTTQCSQCFQTASCSQYRMKSKAVVAMERSIAKREEQNYRPKHDKRARYKEPWRSERE